MRNVFKKMFLSYILIFILPIFIMGLAYYFWASHMAETQARQYYQTSVNEARTSIDNRFNELYNFAIQLSHTSWVLNISNMSGPAIDYSRVDPIELSDHVNELMGYTSINNFIDAVVVAFPEKNTLISSKGIADMDLFWDEIYKLDNMDSKKWKDMISAYNISPVIVHSGISTENGTGSKVTIYIQSLPSSDQKSRAVLIVFINEDVLTSILKGYQTSDGSSLYIQDGDYIAASVNMDEETGDLLSKNKNDYLAFQALSQANNWEYNIVVPLRTVLHKADYIKIITIIIALVLILMDFVLSYWMTLRNYHPLANLINIIKESQVHEDGTVFNNEYNFLEASLNSLLKEEEALRIKTEKQLPLIRNIYLVKLLDSGAGIDKKLVDILESINIKFHLPYFQVMLLYLPVQIGMNDYIQKKFIENFNNPGINIYFIEIDGRKKAVILNCAESQYDRDILKSMKAAMEENLQTAGIAGVGNPYGSMEGIAASYTEAQKAIDYRLIKDQSDIMFFEDIEENNKTHYYYPSDREANMLNELRTGKYDAAMKIVDDLIDVNIRGSKTNITTVRCLFYDLLGTAFKALNELPINNTLEVDHDRISDLKSITEMRRYLGEICKEICLLIEQNKKSHNETLKESIKLYVDDHYTMPNLSLSQVADTMSISSSYLSKFFKEQFGENFLDYLHKKRIEMAKNLLEGQFTVSQIVAMTGYNNDETFRRAFKNYAGITPGEYKNMSYAKTAEA